MFQETETKYRVRCKKIYGNAMSIELAILFYLLTIAVPTDSAKRLCGVSHDTFLYGQLITWVI